MMTRQPSFGMVILPAVLLLWGCFWSTARAAARERPDPPPLVSPGQINLGILADLGGPSDNTSSPSSSPIQGALLVAAALWSLEQMNRVKAPQEFNVGLYVYNTQGSAPLAQRQAFRLIENVGHVQSTLCLEQRIPPVFGIFAKGNETVLGSTVQSIQAFSIPLFLEGFSRLPWGVFSPRPSPRALALSLTDLLSQMGWWRVSLLVPDSPGDDPLRLLREAFLAEAREMDIEVLRGFDKDGTSKAYIILPPPGNVTEALQSVNGKLRPNIPVFVVSNENDVDDDVSRLSLPNSVVTVSPMPHPPDQAFLNFLDRELFGNQTPSEPIMTHFKSQIYPLDPRGKSMVHEVLKKEVQVQTESIAKAVKILVNALRAIEKRSCKRGFNCLPTLRASLHQDMMDVLRPPNASADVSGLHDPRVSFRFSEDGHLATARVGINLIPPGGSPEKVGWYSEDAGLTLDFAKMAAKLGEPGMEKTSKTQPATAPSHWRANLKAGRSFDPDSSGKGEDGSPTPDVANQTENVLTIRSSKAEKNLMAWMSQPWVLTILILCVCGILVTFYIVVFLLMKVCERALKRTNHFLNFALLLSLFFLQFGASLFMFKITPLLCTLQRLFHNLSYIVTFACLLLKAMDLHAKKNLGLGGRSSRLNQLLTLLFIISVQLALEVQWVFLLKAPLSVTKEEVTCNLFKYDFVFSQIYLVVILFMTTVLSYWTRYVPYHHKEGQALFVTTALITVVFIVRVAVYAVVDPGEAKEICSSVGMLLTNLIILCGIYFPQLYSIHKSGSLSHKPLSYTDSFSSVFTLFKDLDDSYSGESSSLKRSRKPPKTLESSYCKSMVELHREPRSLIRTPSLKNNKL